MTLACTVTPAGITAPDYATILASLQNSFWSIYGTDADLDSDSQDGQLLAIFAQAINDANQVAIAVYNSYSPATAQGAALSSAVKINGLARQVPSNSTDAVTITGSVGAIISNGQVGDNLGEGTVWDLPATVTIPGSGTITVTATCQEAGQPPFVPGTLTNILTPTLGWTSVTNVGPSTSGNPVETDAQLRQRQATSTALPAQSINAAVRAAVAALPGVTQVQLYENYTDSTNALGLPPHSISVVVEGGDLQSIASTIALKKTPGTNTYGTQSELVVDQSGVPVTINFSPLVTVPLYVTVTVNPLTGYTTTIGNEIAAAVSNFIDGLATGEISYLARLYSPANLGGTGDGATFVVTAIVQGTTSGGQSAADITAAYNQQFTCPLANVTVLT